MSKKETINVNSDYNYPKVSAIKVPKEKLYKEKTKVRVRETVLDVTLSLEGQIKQVGNDIAILQTRIDNIVKDYLLLKLFRLTANKDERFNKDIMFLDRYINKFKSDFIIVSKFFNAFRKKEEINDKGLSEVFEEVNNLFDFALGLSSDIKDFKTKYYHEFKLSSYALTRDKSVEQIEDLITRVDDELSLYKNIEEANDFIIYNSGKEIISVVEGFVAMKKKENVNLTYHYFLQTDDIIAFKYPEWIELFVKFKYVINKLGDKIVYTDEFTKKYRLLETRYTICSIYNEMYR